MLVFAGSGWISSRAFCAEPSRERAQRLSLISSRGFASVRRLPSLSLSGFDRIRSMTRSALPPRREQIALPKLRKHLLKLRRSASVIVSFECTTIPSLGWFFELGFPPFE